MVRGFAAVLLIALTPTALHAEDGVKGAEEKAVSGMSIVGNDEAPKSLVIVPWKGADLGETLDVSRVVDADRGPVDRDVYNRMLDYYEIRTGTDR